MPLRDCTTQRRSDKQYRGAIEDFNNALRLNLMQQKLMLAEVRYAVIAHNIAKTPNKDYKAAIEDFNPGAARDPGDAKAYVKRGSYGKLAQYSGDPDRDYKAAIEDFNQALRRDPQEAEAYVKRGIVRCELLQRKL